MNERLLRVAAVTAISGAAAKLVAGALLADREPGAASTTTGGP